MILGIDASNISAGGGVTHIVELLNNTIPGDFGVEKVLVWSGNSTLNQIDNKPHIVKSEIKMLNRSLIFRIIWQLFYFDKILRKECDILLSLGGLYCGRFRPYISMSRNMLIFNDVERNRYGFSYFNMRFRILKMLQIKSFKNANGVIFVSEYAKKFISQKLNFKLNSETVIYHGVSDKFKLLPRPQKDIKNYTANNPFKLLYISSIDVYKHQWNLVEAVANLRDKGYFIELQLIGWKMPQPYRKFLKVKEKRDKKNEFIKYFGSVSYNSIIDYYKNADAFIYASTCENMPNILIEAMTAGLPVVCSNYDPMPEILGNAGIFFDPTSINDVEKALKLLISDTELRNLISYAAFFRAKTFDWKKCSIETFNYISNIYNNNVTKRVQ
jgi:glycosyltransferase involved in cell wall biosynthesis